MAALTNQNVAGGGTVTTQAAAGGGDTIEGGTRAGSWWMGCFLYAVIGATSTTITIAGTAYGRFSNATVLLPALAPTMHRGTAVNVTYNQVTGVSVAAVEMTPRV